MPEKKLNLLAEKEGIRHEIMQPGDLEQTIACIIDAFPRAEPMTKALRITPDEFYLFAEMYCKKAIKDRLSVIAKDTVSGNVIGFLISENLASEPPEGIETIHEKFHPIMAQYKRSCHQVPLDSYSSIIIRSFMSKTNLPYGLTWL